MKNKYSLFILMSLILFCSLSVCHAEKNEDAFFTGDGFTVTREDLMVEEEMLTKRFQTTRDEKLRVILMDRLFSTALQKQGVPLLDRKILRMTDRYLSLLYQKKIKESVDISDLVLESFYKSNPERFTRPGKFDLSMIMVPHKFLCRKIFLDVTDGGRDFEEAAEAESVDEETRLKKGSLGWMEYKRMPKAFVVAIEGLAGDQIITEPFMFNGKWVMLKKNSYDPPELKPFNEVREGIRARLTNKEVAKQRNLEFERLKKAYNVQ